MDKAQLLAVLKEKLNQDIPINEIKKSLLNSGCTEQEFEESLIGLWESLKDKLLKTY
jgi:hypothetical protein